MANLSNKWIKISNEPDKNAVKIGYNELDGTTKICSLYNWSIVVTRIMCYKLFFVTNFFVVFFSFLACKSEVYIWSFGLIWNWRVIFQKVLSQIESFCRKYKKHGKTVTSLGRNIIFYASILESDKKGLRYENFIFLFFWLDFDVWFS